MPQLTVCPSCAERLEPEDKFCGNCGTDLAAAAVASARKPWQPPAHADGSLVAPRTGEPAAGRPAPGYGPPPPRQEPDTAPGDYGLAPPELSAAATPYQAPRPEHSAPGVVPRAGATDPREVLLTEGDSPARPCVACGTGTVDPDGYCGHCGHAQPRERDHMEEELAGVAAVTDRGLRHHRNEDAFAVCTVDLPDGGPAVVAVVCDGVSSAARPDEASAAAARSASASLRTALADGTAPREAMHQALLTAAEAVNSLADDHDPDPDANAPACTCVSAITTGDLLTVGWIGDSRAYWIPDDRTGEQPARLTEDDSWAARMVEAGLMSEAEAYADVRAHAITGWLGADAVELDPHTASFQPDRPGVVIVCTDGLWNYAESAAELAAVVPADAREHPLRSARTLVGVALDGGGHDNVTVAVLPFPTPQPG
ncbi:PP2C family serine/threonine-protein phosphatase [Streptantibioticus rubrisoli]|uniref:Protein phosphatase 2C domain-containing protein n=1 Tax=Streptantibioticus rubrisoli TaxID=1387313 RepID=A0ABT1PJ85_9ACTN|nr:protein phosphatase 2C domain-containing protein [Streptantibioticus rubrisoli]MCQ4045429.1 protein phosphatase 2C domain-containing protein [Streptantibioticus rubrisoli]